MQPGAFFREPYHYERLARTVLPALVAERRRRLRLWSAGCASGEAAWSLAMVVEEADAPPELDIAILATDPDPGVLARAGDAIYRDDEMNRVNARRRRSHFVRGVGPRSGLWRVTAPLRDRVEFVELDLMDAWPACEPARGAFDVVFCHDAFSRLDPRGALGLVRRFAGVLAPGGVLLLGQPPVLSDAPPGLEPFGRAALRKPF